MPVHQALDLYPSNGSDITFGDLKEFVLELARQEVAEDALMAVAVNLRFRMDGLSTLRRLSVIKDGKPKRKQVER